MRRVVPAVFLDFNEPFEGYTTWLYLDVKALVTTAVGILVDPLSMAVHLPWRIASGDVLGRMATAEEISAAWRAVKSRENIEATALVKAIGAQEAAKAWRKLHPGVALPLQLQGGGAFKSLTTIRLARGDVDALVRRKLYEMAGILREQFPAFDEWPADAELATLSVCWARGPNRLARAFPRMAAALQVRDFARAAEECDLANGYAERNAANRALFRAAARCDRDRLDPEVLHYATPAPPSIVDTVDLKRGIRKAIEDDRETNPDLGDDDDAA